MGGASPVKAPAPWERPTHPAIGHLDTWGKPVGIKCLNLALERPGTCACWSDTGPLYGKLDLLRAMTTKVSTHAECSCIWKVKVQGWRKKKLMSCKDPACPVDFPRSIRKLWADGISWLAGPAPVPGVATANMKLRGRCWMVPSDMLRGHTHTAQKGGHCREAKWFELYHWRSSDALGSAYRLLGILFRAVSSSGFTRMKG